MVTKDVAEIIHDLQRTAAHYLENVDRFSLEQLQEVPAEGGWSLGQMYMHLIGSALYMQIASANRCLAGNGDHLGDGAKTEAGTAVFDLGSFPPIRVHVPPSPQYTPQQPDSKEQITGGLSNVLEQMELLGSSLADYDESHTALHPRLGALNAMEWFALTEMHYRHHLAQENRLIQELGLEASD